MCVKLPLSMQADLVVIMISCCILMAKLAVAALLNHGVLSGKKFQILMVSVFNEG